MKIGISTGNFHDSKALRASRILYRDEGYKRMKAAGYDCADYGYLSVTGGYLYTGTLEDAIADAKREREIAATHGITISQAHGPWPTYDTTPELRREKLKWMERAIRITPHLGTPYLVIHPDLPFGWYEELDPEFTRKTNVEMFEALLPIAEEVGTVICLENMPTEPYTMSPTPEIYKFIQQINHPNLQMCLDTGHAHVFGHDCGDMVRLIAPVLKVMHVHDNLVVHDMHLWPHEGTIDWDSFSKALADIKYDGVLSLEASLREKNMFTDPTHHESACRLARIAREIADNAAEK